MLRYVVGLCALVAIVSAGSLTVSDCTGADAHTGKITEVYSPNFTSTEEIVFLKGETYTFGIKFTAGENSPQLEPTIYGIISGIKVGWSGVNKEACQDLIETNKCPLMSGKAYHYSTSINILKSYPATRLTFQWGLTAKSASGTKTKNQVCFTMEAQIK